MLASPPPPLRPLRLNTGIQNSTVNCHALGIANKIKPTVGLKEKLLSVCHLIYQRLKGLA